MEESGIKWCSMGDWDKSLYRFIHASSTLSGTSNYRRERTYCASFCAASCAVRVRCTFFGVDVPSWCRLGMGSEEFERTVERPLSEADPFNTEVMDFSHALLAPAQDVEVDKQGRTRIPVPLRQLAGLEREIMINSLMNRIEIWDRQVWDARFEESLKRAQQITGMPRGQGA